MRGNRRTYKRGEAIPAGAARIAAAGMMTLLLCLFLGVDAQAASPRPLGDAENGDAALHKLYEDCRQAAWTIDQNERLARIDELIALHGGDSSEDVDYAITWLTAAKAASLTGGSRLQALEQGLARHPERAGLSERIAAVVAGMEMSKAKMTEDKAARRALLEKVAAENVGASSAERRSALMAAINLLAKEAEKKTARRELYDRALAAYVPEDGDKEEAAEAIRALKGRVELSDRSEWDTLASGIIARFDAAPDEGVQAWVAWARRLRTVGETGEKRLESCLEMVRKHKNHSLPFIRKRLVEVVVRSLSTARDSSNRKQFQDSLLDELRGSPAEGLMALVLSDQADMMENREARFAAYRGIVEQFKGDATPQVRKCVVDAARWMLRLAADKPAAVALCEEIAGANAESDDRDMQSAVNQLLLACADAPVDKAKKIELYDAFLERYRRGLKGISHHDLGKALYGKAAVTNAPSLAAEFFAERIASAGSEDELFLVLKAKSECSYFDSVQEEGRRELVARFIDTNDAEKAIVVMKTVEYDARPGECPDAPSPVYASMAERFAGAKDGKGFKVYLKALMSQARTSVGIDDGIRLCDRIVDAIQARKDDNDASQELEEALTLKSQLTGDSSILAGYYEAKSAEAVPPWQKKRLLLMQAKYEVDRKVRAAIYDGIINAQSDKPGSVASEMIDRALESADRDEAVVRFRAAADAVKKSDKASSSQWMLGQAFGKLALLAPDRTARLALYDELIQFALERGESNAAVRAMMQKAERVDSDAERVAIYDRAMETMSSDSPNLHLWSLVILAKAYCLEDPAERIRLCDMIIDRIPDDYNLPFLERWRKLEALVVKAEALGDESVIVSYIDDVLARDVVIAENMTLAVHYAKFAGDLAGRLRSRRLRDEALVKITGRYGVEPSFVMEEALDEIRAGLAPRSAERKAPRLLDGWMSPGDVRDPYECQQMKSAGFRGLRARVEKEPKLEDKIRLIEEFVDGIAPALEDDTAFLALFLKADLVPEAHEKRQVFEEILERALGWRGQGSWYQALKVVSEWAELIEEPSEKVKFYDSMIARFTPVWDAGHEIMVPLYHVRAECIADREEKIAELRRIIAHFGKRGAEKFVLEPIRDSLNGLEAEGSGGDGAAAE